jgi:hypothetical protein
MVALLMPATSPAVSSSSVALKPLRSQYFRYWRSSMLAQSQASVPPAPAWMSMKQLLGSAGLLNMRRNSSSSTVARAAWRSRPRWLAGRRRPRRPWLMSNSSALSARLLAQVVDGPTTVEFQRLLLAAQFLGALGVVPDRRVLQRGVDFVQPQALRS